MFLGGDVKRDETERTRAVFMTPSSLTSKTSELSMSETGVDYRCASIGGGAKGETTGNTASPNVLRHSAVQGPSHNSSPMTSLFAAELTIVCERMDGLGSRMSPGRSSLRAAQIRYPSMTIVARKGCRVGRAGNGNTEDHGRACLIAKLD